MSQSTNTAGSPPQKPPQPDHPHSTGATGLGELGKTTSSRGWLALVALALVIVGFGIWGLFGTIPVQTTIPATVTNGVYPIEVSSPVDGTVTSIPTATNTTTVPAGTELMTITPRGGGKPVAVTAPIEMGFSLDVVAGSPVTTQTVVAHGSPISAAGADNDGKAQVYAFLSTDVVASLRSAESMTVTPNAPSLAGDQAPIELTYVGSIPVTQDQIALLTGGNTIYAQNAYEEAGGAPYAVLFKYLNAADANTVNGTAAAQITVTQSSPHPLSLLFSS